MGVNSEAFEVIKSGSNGKFNSEREFRERVISRLLESLGWNLERDVQYEYAIPVATTTLRVDYLVGNSQPFALEAKQPNVDISLGSGPWSQILDYLRLDRSIKYGVLYNGKSLHILRNGMERPLVSWVSKTNVSAFEYLSKSSYPSLLDLEVALVGYKTENGADSILSLSNAEGNSDKPSSVDDYLQILLNRTVMRERMSLYMIGVTFASILALGFLIGSNPYPLLVYVALDMLMAFGFLTFIAAFIFYYFKVRSLMRKKAKIK